MSVDRSEQLGRIDTAGKRQQSSRGEAILERERRKLRYTALRRRRGIFRERSAH